MSNTSITGVVDSHKASTSKSAKRNALETAIEILSQMKASVEQYKEADVTANDMRHYEDWESLSTEINTLIEILAPHKNRCRPQMDTPCYLEHKGRSIARGKWLTDGKILVFAGSEVLPMVLGARTTSCILERQELEKNGVIKNGKFIQDHLFSSVSAAAATVLGRCAAQGPRLWRHQDGSYLY